jgi:hypothetical protein
LLIYIGLDHAKTAAFVAVYVYIIANWAILVKYYSSTHFSGLERFTAIFHEDLAIVITAAILSL